MMSGCGERCRPTTELLRRVLLEKIADLDQQFLLARQFLGGDVASRAALGQLVHRQHEREVNDGSDDKEVDECADDRAEGELRLTARDGGDRDDESSVEAFRVEHGPDERVDHGVNDNGDDCGECGTDNDRDREVDDVSASNEVFEALKHVVCFPSW